MTSPFQLVGMMDYSHWSKEPRQKAFVGALALFRGMYDQGCSENLETLLSSFQELVKHRSEFTLLKLGAMLDAQCDKQRLQAPPKAVLIQIAFLHLAMKTLLMSCPDPEIKRVVARFQIPWARYCLHNSDGILNLSHSTWKLYFWISYSVSTMTAYTRRDIIEKLNRIFDLMDRPRSIRDLQIDGALAIAEEYQYVEHRRIKSIALIAKRWQGNLKIMLARETASTLLSPPPSLERVPEVAFDLVEIYQLGAKSPFLQVGDESAIAKR